MHLSNAECIVHFTKLDSHSNICKLSQAPIFLSTRTRNRRNDGLNAEIMGINVTGTVMP